MRTLFVASASIKLLEQTPKIRAVAKISSCRLYEINLLVGGKVDSLDVLLDGYVCSTRQILGGTYPRPRALVDRAEVK